MSGEIIDWLVIGVETGNRFRSIRTHERLR